MRYAVTALATVLIVGCATLPEIHPWLEPTGEAKTPTVVGTRGPLRKQTVDAILARLQKKAGGSDLFERHLEIEEAVAGTPLTVGNSASLLQDGPASYQAMFDAIERARDHVNAEFYIIEHDTVGLLFADLLLRKAAQGVSVNLIYDSVGSLQTPPDYFRILREGGVSVLEYNPVNPLKARAAWRLNNRNHRKVVVADGQIAFTGGINISDVYSSGSAPGSGSARSGASSGSSRFPSGGSRPASGKTGEPREVGWRDVNVRIEGPAVEQLQRIFLETWAQQGGDPIAERNWFPAQKRQGKHPVRVVASGPEDALPSIYLALLSAIAHAEKTVHITMAYFVPDPQTIDSLKSAAARGVDVSLVLPSYTDFWPVFHAGRSHYSDLLEAGVKIYERQTALLHSKTAVIDGVWSTVGSSNMDWRSFLHNKELNVVVLGWDFGREMEAMFDADRRASVQIEREAWARRPLEMRMREWLARMWEYWL
ncbi:MAG: phospholipase D-like domain-containing protein [Burkholderiales bacterium]